MEEVAQRARVSKTTIYRRWPSKGMLVFEALAEIWQEWFVGPVRAQHRVMIDRAVERGEVSADADPEVLLDLLFGPAYHRLLQSHLPLSDRFAQAVVDTVVAGVAVTVAVM